MNRQAAFSLTEVMVAIGVLAFCLVSILGLVSTGLRVTRDNTEELAAGQALAAVGTALRSAFTTNGTDFQAAPPFQAITWKLGGPTVTAVCWHGDDGRVTATPPPGASRVVLLSILPSPSPELPVTASVTVGWPGSAARVVDWRGGSGQPPAPELAGTSGWIGAPVLFSPRL
jgi:type II secretory pathway pseudopilin PulG